jgi:hypothetical protein
MAKTLLHRLFGVGTIPRSWRTTIEAEGAVVVDEGIGGSITYRDFHAPGKRFTWRKVGFTGAIALTKTRLVALQYSSPAINVPLADERFDKLEISIEGNETLLIAFDPSLFHSDWSGRLEYRFRTSAAAAVLDHLRNRG